MPTPAHPLIGKLGAVARALAVRRFARALVLLLAYVAGGLLVVVVLGKLDVLPATAATRYTAAAVAAATVLALAEASRVRVEHAAAALDRRLELRERMTTALEVVRGGGDGHGRRGPLADRVVAEALAAAPRGARGLFRWRLGRPALAAAAGVVAVVVALRLPARAPAAAAAGGTGARHRVARAAGKKVLEQAKSLELAAGKSRRVTALPALKKLERVGERIAAGGLDTRAAAAGIREARREAERSWRDAGLDTAAPHLDRALAALAADPATGEVAAALQAADAERLIRALDALARAAENGGLDARGLEAAARGFEALGRALADADPATAEQLRALASAARAGDLQRLADGLRGMRSMKLAEQATTMCATRSSLLAVAQLIAGTQRLLGLAPEKLTGRDYGFGSTDREAPAFAVGPRHPRERNLPLTADAMRDYHAVHPPRMLEGAHLESAATGAMPGAEGEVGYVERRVAGGRMPLRLARDAVPGVAVAGAEEALGRDEVPAGYREHVRRYFAPTAEVPAGEAR